MDEFYVAEKFNEFQDLISSAIHENKFTADEIATFCLVLGASARLGLDGGKIENFNLCLKQALKLYEQGTREEK